MANYIDAWKIVAIVDMLKVGYTIRPIAKRLGISKLTVEKYATLFGPEHCPCGKFRVHKGFCYVRVALLPTRQAFIRTQVHVRPETERFWREYAAAAERAIA